MHAQTDASAAARTSQAPPELTKEQAAGRAQSLKRVLGWTAVLMFGFLWQAASHHATGVTSRNRSTASTGTTGGTAPAQSPGFSFTSGQGMQPFTQTTVS
jgi:hypothetical protein